MWPRFGLQQIKVVMLRQYSGGVGVGRSGAVERLLCGGDDSIRYLNITKARRGKTKVLWQVGGVVHKVPKHAKVCFTACQCLPRLSTCDKLTQALQKT